MGYRISSGLKPATPGFLDTPDGRLHIVRADLAEIG
jgi:hypothetical protein